MKMWQNQGLLICALMLAPIEGRSADSAALDRALEVKNAAQSNVMALQQNGEFWNLPLYLGRHYISQYYLLRHWIGTNLPTRFDMYRFQQELSDSQLADGSWEAIHDASNRSGDLNATILNYWALKAMGISIDTPRMQNARRFVVSHGGVERSSVFTKIILALFRGYSWDIVPSIPYALFIEGSPVSYHDFGQWIGPHIMPLAYFKSMKLSKDLGPQFAIDELWANSRMLAQFRVSQTATVLRRNSPGMTDQLLIERMADMQRPRGSFGGYTMSTMFSIIAQDDFATYYPASAPRLRRCIEREFQFIEESYFNSGDGTYRGTTMDGRYWDTALVGNAAVESGVSRDRVASAARLLVSKQASVGSFGFGQDFETFPDTDTTAEILMFLDRAGGFGNSLARGAAWILSMQNSDGGWGAFDRNNNGNALLRFFAKRFEDSADLFDESSPDVTGHILEALGQLGQNSRNSESVRRAVEYLRNSQTSFGGWFGRWGINYLYGTSAAVVGLIRVGESPRAPDIQHALRWLTSRQNADGGFGESFLSYTQANYRGVGLSTPSQTAWVLLALIEAGRAQSVEADRAVQYLVDQFHQDGKWIDRSTVGTGHPGIVAMDYPSYPYAFPLVAISRYLHAHGR